MATSRTVQTDRLMGLDDKRVDIAATWTTSAIDQMFPRMGLSVVPVPFGLAPTPPSLPMQGGRSDTHAAHTIEHRTLLNRVFPYEYGRRRSRRSDPSCVTIKVFRRRAVVASSEARRVGRSRPACG
jgi:hypothetical protein